jgi:preprotein translocase subunit SecG
VNVKYSVIQIVCILMQIIIVVVVVIIVVVGCGSGGGGGGGGECKICCNTEGFYGNLYKELTV